MDITPVLAKGTNFINGYSSGYLKINNQLVKNDIILAANILYDWENSDGIFTPSSYQQIIAEIEGAKPKVGSMIIIIGTGGIALSPPLGFSNIFTKHGIVPEIMTTPAACRTFNVLVSEGRCVYAMLKVG